MNEDNMNVHHASELTAPLNHDEIARFASSIWEKEGRPSGRDLEFWLQAEALLRAAHQPIAEPPSTETPQPALLADKPAVTRNSTLAQSRTRTPRPGNRGKCATLAHVH